MDDTNQIYEGFCQCCGTEQEFIDEQKPLRENFLCSSCGASMRERLLAEAFVTSFGNGRYMDLSLLIANTNFSDLKILEIGFSGSIRKLLSRLPNYHHCYCFNREEKKSELRFENLESLSFNDQSFDIVLTSEIMDKVREPFVVFDEVHRVLKPGGCHIFSVPSNLPLNLETNPRVEINHFGDQHLMSPRFSGDGRGGKCLVYNDFGSDLFERIDSLGFKTLSLRGESINDKRRRANVFISIAL